MQANRTDHYDNKGCAATTTTTLVKEQLTTGWTPANPSIKTNSDGDDVTSASTSTDLESNVVIWTLNTIDADKYAVLTYQIKTPTTTSTAGTLNFNATWDGSREVFEPNTYAIQTFNYTEESHLEFDLEAIQREDSPQPEVRTAQLNKSYNYTLTTTNIGDIATTDEWNVSLTIPGQCQVTNVSQNGTFDITAYTIQLPTKKSQHKRKTSMERLHRHTNLLQIQHIRQL